MKKNKVFIQNISNANCFINGFIQIHLLSSMDLFKFISCRQWIYLNSSPVVNGFIQIQLYYHIFIPLDLNGLGQLIDYFIIQRF